MPRKKAGGGKRGQKSPAPKKSAKSQAQKVTTGRAKCPKKVEIGRRTMSLRGRKATSLAQALDLIPPGYEVILQDPKTKAFLQIHGDAEKGVPKKTKCTCLSLAKRCCKKHPSRIKVRTGHFIVQSDGPGKTRRRAVWVPKVLVDKGIIKVKKDVKFRVNKMNGKSI